MTLTTKLLSAVLGVALLGSGIAVKTQLVPSAAAQTMGAKQIVDQAKTQGLVGERLDGYLGLVTANVPANVQAAVNEINIRRKSVYTKLARAQSISVQDVASLTGEKLIAKAKLGEKYMGANGLWSTVGGA